MIAFLTAAGIAFWRSPYPTWDLTEGLGMTGSPACCPWYGPMQPGLLHLPRVLRDRRPLVWSWEVSPVAPGRRWLNVGGSVWVGDTLPPLDDPLQSARRQERARR